NGPTSPAATAPSTAPTSSSTPSTSPAPTPPPAAPTSPPPSGSTPSPTTPSAPPAPSSPNPPPSPPAPWRSFLSCAADPSHLTQHHRVRRKTAYVSSPVRHPRTFLLNAPSAPPYHPRAPHVCSLGNHIDRLQERRGKCPVPRTPAARSAPPS